MYTLIVILILLSLYALYRIVIVAQLYNDGTWPERYGASISQLVKDFARGFSSIVFRLTEPKEKREKRLATEELGIVNGIIYRSCTRRKDLTPHLTVRKDLEKALEVLGLPEDDWKELAYQLFYLGCIRRLSRNPHDYSERNDETTREDIVHEWPHNELSCEYSTVLSMALDYYGIPVED